MILLSINDILSKILQLIASLSIIVIIHELGHFLPAKLFGCKVEKFYLFFDAWFSVFKKKVKDTEYGIGWIPLGGYVKISGMIDESLDKKDLEKEPQPWEFRSKKPWQKIIIMAGGVFMNLILGAVIFIGLTYHYGDEYIPNSNLKYGLHFHETLQSIGLQDGDVITKIGDKNVDNYNQYISEIILNEAKNIIVLRNGQELKLTIPDGFVSTLGKQASKRNILIEPRFPIIIDSVKQNKTFIKGALLKGDKIIAFNKIEITYLNELNELKKQFKDSIVQISVLRDRKTENILVKIDKNSSIGFITKIPNELLQTKITSFTFFESIPVGIKKAYKTLSNYLTGLKLLFTSKEVKVSENLGGPISIGNMFPSDFDWHQFWILTAVISISIGIMNLLPIPALDGGHIIFGFYELISGKKPSLKFQEYSQMIGMAILFGLMFYAIGLDIFRIFK